MSAHEDHPGLFGPDVTDTLAACVEDANVIDVGDPIEVWTRQFCNRWVFLPHHRPAALKELRAFVAAVQKDRR